MGNVLAVDIGGSKLLVGTVDESGRVLNHERFALPPAYDGDYLMDKLCEMAQNQGQFSPRAAGVAIPGLADPEKGVWMYAPFSGLSDIPVAKILSERLGLPVFVENDVNACALGEKLYGACRNDENFLWVTVSNGIGGGLVLNGELYRGDGYNAGEIGHFIVDESGGHLCGCGNTGCLEAVASGRAISEAYRKLTGIDKTALEIAAAAKSGDENAKKAYADAGCFIGKAVAYCVNLLNLDKVVLGGGVAQDFDLLQEPIDGALKRYVFRQANPSVEVCQTALGYHAALIGCAAVARKGLGLW